MTLLWVHVHGAQNSVQMVCNWCGCSLRPNFLFKINELCYGYMWCIWNICNFTFSLFRLVVHSLCNNNNNNIYFSKYNIVSFIFDTLVVLCILISGYQTSAAEAFVLTIYGILCNINFSDIQSVIFVVDEFI